MPEILEVEVVEIDGVTPPPPKKAVEEEPPVGQRLPGGFTFNFRGFNRRWWPLWLLGGLLLSVFILAGLLVAGVVFMISKLIGLVLTPFRVSSPRSTGSHFSPIRRE